MAKHRLYKAVAAVADLPHSLEKIRLTNEYPRTPAWTVMEAQQLRDLRMLDGSIAKQKVKT